LNAVVKVRLPRSVGLWTALVFVVPYAAVALRFAVPDTLNLFEWASAPSAVLAPLFFRWPIAAFDAATGDAFAPSGGGFIIFPSVPQLTVMLLFDVALSYALARVLVALLGRREREAIVA
jgi:hypothetical protein